MELLFVGNMLPVTDRFFDLFLTEHHCVAARSVDTNMKSGKKLAVHRYYKLEELEDIFVAYHFDAILFFSYDLDGGLDVYKELERLEVTLTLARKYDVGMFLYVTSNELENKDKETVLEGRARYIINTACEDLCRVFQNNCGIKTRIIRLPYIYTKEPSGTRNCYLMRLAGKEGEIILRADPEREIDLICDEDLGTFLMRVLDDPGDEDIRTLNLGGGNRMQYGKFAELLTGLMPGLKVGWLGEQYAFPMYLEEKRVQDDFDWEPVNRLEDDIEALYRGVVNEKKSASETGESDGAAQGKKKRFTGIRHPLDLVLIMGVAELLARLVPDGGLFSAWDIRLAAVLLLGMMDGLAAGIAGAVIAVLLYLVSVVTKQNIFVLFREPTALIPPALYVLAGGISGYLCDHKNDEIDRARAESALQKDRYVFLNGLYARARESKEDFQNQILGFRNSYGRIYALLKRIEAADDKDLYKEAVASMEEMLESRNIAIYKRVGAGEHYTEQARSRGAARRVPETISLKDYPEIYEMLKDKQTYVNRELKAGYPAFAAAILSGDEMSGIIMVTESKYRHMNTEYANKFSVVTGIISVDLVRAMRLHGDLEGQIMEAGLMAESEFAKLVRGFCDDTGRVSERHSLLHLKPVNMTVREAVRRASRTIRGDDVIGADTQNRLLLLLPGTGEDGARIVMEKLRSDGIDSEIVRSVID